MSSLVLQLRWELHKLFSRRRTLIGFAALFAFEVLLLFLLHDGAIRAEVRRTILRAGFTFTENFTGPTIADFVMSNAMSFLGNIQIALVAGELVSKEIEDGTMRMLLCRPIRRGRVLLGKLLTGLIFTCAVTSFIAVTSLLLGLLYQGPGFWLILSPKEQYVAHHEFWPGLVRYGAATGFMTLGCCSVTALAFMLSCLNMKPAAAAVVALSVFVADDTLRNLPYFASVKAHFVMSHIVGWIHLYDRRIPWEFLVRNYTILMALDTVLITAGWLAFQRRDLKP